MAVVREYGRFENDPDIGEIESSDWRLHLKAIVVHEAAHAVQHGLLASDSNLHRGKRFYEGLGCFESSHSRFFQEIYRRLRRELVNPSASGSRVGRAGAKTRMSSRPDLSQAPHACIGKTIRIPRLGGCEAVEFLGRSVLAWAEHGECPLKRLPADRFEKAEGAEEEGDQPFSICGSVADPLGSE